MVWWPDGLVLGFPMAKLLALLFKRAVDLIQHGQLDTLRYVMSTVFHTALTHSAQVLLDGVLELAEVQFYMHLVIEEKDHYIAIASVFGPPHPHLLDISSQVFWTVQHMREADVRAFAVTCIQSCAMMAPDEQYAQFQEREEGSEQDR
jgi:hypothetical protein